MYNAAYIFVFSEHVCMINDAYISFITINSISAFDSGSYFWFGVSCVVSIKVRCPQQFFQVIYGKPYIVTLRLVFIVDIDFIVEATFIIWVVFILGGGLKVTDCNADTRANTSLPVVT